MAAPRLWRLSGPLRGRIRGGTLSDPTCVSSVVLGLGHIPGAGVGGDPIQLTRGTLKSLPTLFAANTATRDPAETHPGRDLRLPHILYSPHRHMDTAGLQEQTPGLPGAQA